MTKLNTNELKDRVKNGDVQAHFDLATLYLNGSIFHFNGSAKAFSLYKEAAENDHLEAQVLLGCMYDAGVGVTKSPNQVFRWYKTAAENGSADAWYILAQFYCYGIEVEQSQVEYRVCLRNAALMGYINAALELSFELESVEPKSPDEAYFWSIVAGWGMPEKSLIHQQCVEIEDRAATWLKEHPNKHTPMSIPDAIKPWRILAQVTQTAIDKTLRS